MAVTITGLGSVIDAMNVKVEGLKVNALKAGQEIAQLLETYAKQNHPWKDDTGDTRDSIRGEIVEFTDQLVHIAVSASMSYDVYLELYHGEKWSWLLPAVLANESKIMDIIKKHALVGIQGSSSLKAFVGGFSWRDFD